MNSRDLVARIASELGSTATASGTMLPTAPPVVADHELVRRIGAGSYGEVWLARGVTGIWRAVKVVARSRFESERPFEREFRGVVQFEPISRSHAGLIQVLHVGRDEAVGAFYYVMELADDVAEVAMAGEADKPEATRRSSRSRIPEGDAFSSNYQPRTLRSELDARGKLPVAEVVALGVQLCGALGHIHRHGLVHRDVKPSNVIFVQGLAKLADLGLVATASEARSFVGTEGFIPPEGPGTVQADLFALGRLLYEAATGKDRCEYPELPPDMDGWPDREALLELNEVLARLCAPDPARRCSNAAEAAGDLNLLLAGRSVRRAYGLERRLRRLTQFSAVVLGVLALAAGAVWVQEMRQRRESARAERERSLRERAQGAERNARQQLYAALLEQARATVRSGELGQRVRALDAIQRAAAISNTVELRREAVAAFALPDFRFARNLDVGLGFTARQLDPDFERVASCVGRGPIEIRWLAEEGRTLTLPAAANLMCYDLRWSPDGRYLAAKRERNPAAGLADFEIWDMAGEPQRVLWIRETRGDVKEFHPRQPQFLTGSVEGEIVTWDLTRGVELDRRRLAEGVPVAAAFSPDTRILAAVHRRGWEWTVTIHDAADDSVRSSRRLDAAPVALVWHPEGKWVALTDFGGNVHLLEAATGAFHTLGRHRAEAVTAAFAPTGDYLVTGGWERSLICWDLATRQRAFIVELDAYHFRFRADGRQCALMTPTEIQIHGFERPIQRRFWEDLGSRLRFAAFSNDGQWLAASADERLGVWEIRKSGPGALTDTGAQASPYWTGEGRELIASRRDSNSFRWRVHPPSDAGQAPILEPMPIGRPEGFAWLSAASDRWIWTSAKGSQITAGEQVYPEEGGWIPTAFGMNGTSPGGQWLGIYRGYTPLLHVYRFPELTHVATLTNRGNIAGFQFAPGDEEVGVASRGQVEFWSTRTWERTRVLTNFAGIPHVGLLVQPDGSGWWLAQHQRFACLHHPRTFEPLLPLPSAMSPLALSADGRHLAVAAEARMLEVWDLHELRERMRALGLEVPWEALRPQSGGDRRPED